MTNYSKFVKKILALSFSTALVAGAALPTLSSATGFTDIKEGKWYTEAVNALATDTILEGYKDGSFKPLNNMTKAETVKVIALAKGLDVENVKSPDFSDVKEDAWYYKYIAAAKEAGIVLGDGNGKFEPGKKINRAEMASLLVKAFNLEGEPEKNSFTDVKTSDWYYDEIQALIANEVTIGTTTTTFSPKALLNRAQGAEFVYRSINLPVEEDTSKEEVDTEAPVAGELSIELDGDSDALITADFAGAVETTIELPLDSTLTALSLEITDENLVKEDVTVQLTAVPEDYPTDAPAVPNTWGTLQYNETSEKWDLLVPETNNPYTFSLAGDYTLEATFSDEAGNETKLVITTKVVSGNQDATQSVEEDTTNATVEETPTTTTVDLTQDENTTVITNEEPQDSSPEADVIGTTL